MIAGDRLVAAAHSLDSGETRKPDLGAPSPASRPMSAVAKPQQSFRSPVLESVGLERLMASEAGRREVVVALLDGPVALSHPALSGARIRTIGQEVSAPCVEASEACRHGTFVAGILSANRSSHAPAICPGCTLLVRPIFSDRSGSVFSDATADQLARALLDVVEAGARLINISGALSPTTRPEPQLETALAIAAGKGALVIAAAGNDGAVASSPLTRHPAVIPVTACDAMGRPMPVANLAHSVGARGLAAPGTITSISPEGRPVTLSGTSFAAALVSGACALLWSALTHASRNEIAVAVMGAERRTSLTPPRLDTWGAYQRLRALRAAA
jgi:subtilisin family serine protease